MKHISFISVTILAGVLSASVGGATAAQEVAGAPEQSSPEYSCRVVTSQVDDRTIDYDVCVDGTPLLVQPIDQYPICLLDRGANLWLHGMSGSHVQASVQSGPCSGKEGWVSKLAIGRNGRCPM